MALGKSITLPDGAVATYHRVRDLAMTNGQSVVHAEVDSYASKSIRDADVTLALQASAFVLSGVPDKDPFVWAYEQLEAQVADFAGATAA